MFNLAEQLKNINLIVRNSEDNDEIIKNILEYLEQTFEADSIIIGFDGTIIYEKSNKLSALYFQLENQNVFEENCSEKLYSKVEEQICIQLNNLAENKLNVKLSNLDSNSIDKNIFSNVFGSFIPIVAGKTRIATLIFYREDIKFDEIVHIINEFLSNLVGIALINNIKNQEASKERNIFAVKSAMNTLSYTELEAIISIFLNFEDEEGIVITSKIADIEGITRSVIVNALRKFESAGIIETSSLGMKGTHIKILNNYLKVEINKFQNFKSFKNSKSAKNFD